MEALFDVYAHTDGRLWGVGQHTNASKVPVVSIQPGQQEGMPVYKHEAVTPTRVGGLIHDRLQKGFVLHGTNQFFDEDTVSFMIEHPDFVRGQRLLGKYVVAVAPDAIPNALMACEVHLNKAVAAHCAPAALVKEWLQSQEMATRYLVAATSHPVFALVLAELALTHKWELLVRGHAMEIVPLPSKAASTWMRVFSDDFPASQLVQTLHALGWMTSKAAAVVAPLNSCGDSDDVLLHFLL